MVASVRVRNAGNVSVGYGIFLLENSWVHPGECPFWRVSSHQKEESPKFVTQGSCRRDVRRGNVGTTYRHYWALCCFTFVLQAVLDVCDNDWDTVGYPKDDEEHFCQAAPWTFDVPLYASWIAIAHVSGGIKPQHLRLFWHTTVFRGTSLNIALPSPRTDPPYSRIEASQSRTVHFVAKASIPRVFVGMAVSRTSQRSAEVAVSRVCHWFNHHAACSPTVSFISQGPPAVAA